MPSPPTLRDLERLAERALAYAHGDGEAQVLAVWERSATGDALTVEVTRVVDGRAAIARAGSTGDAELRRAAHAAAALARRPRAWSTAGLPDPAAVSPHDGFVVSALEHRAPPVPELPGVAVDVQVGAVRVAVASTRGVRACDERSYATAAARAGGDGRSVRLSTLATAPERLDLHAMAREARWLLMEGRPTAPAPSGEVAVVLGPDAVAVVLDHLRAGFGVELDLGAGPLAGRMGERVAGASVHLREAPRHPQIVPRACDAEGMPRREVTLIEDGVATARVHDTASARRAGTSTTGHATRAAALAPLPEHLVLEGGDAAAVEELWAPVRRGLYVPALSPERSARASAYLHRTVGAVLVHDGEAAAPVDDARVAIEPLALLGDLEALTVWQRAIPLRGQTPGGPAAVVSPAVRVAPGAGLRVLAPR